MTRVKAAPRKARSAPIKTASILTTASLNTRIHRILNASAELKQKTIDSTFFIPAAGLNQIFYCNPLAAITQGTSSGQRVGDSIRVEKISVVARWFPSFGASAFTNDLDLTFRNVMMKVEDQTLTSTAPVAWGITNLVYGGFAVNGVLNTHDNSIVHDKIFNPKARCLTQGVGAPTGGQGYHVYNFKVSKKFGTAGFKYDYGIGTNVGGKQNFVIGQVLDTPGYVGAAVQGTMYYTYTVEYRDV